MAEKTLQQDVKMRWLGVIAGAVLTVFAGFLLEQNPGEGLARTSYDLPFNRSLYKSPPPPNELIMVYLDGDVKRNLGQPPDQPLDRHFYTLLLDRLTREKAKLVFFDILFDEPSPNRAVDQQFAGAIQKMGHVVLVSGWDQNQQENSQADILVPPTAILSSVADSGSAKCPIDPDYAIRRLAVGDKDQPSAGWVAACLLGATVTNQTQSSLTGAWINFYCPPGQLRSVNLDHAIATNGLPDGYFANKIVVIGARPQIGVAGDKREVFHSPYSMFGWSDATGPAVQGFNLLNLLRGDWLNRMATGWEIGMVISWGVILAIVLMFLRPWPATLCALGCLIVVGLIASYSQLHLHVWFNWLIPAAVQPAIALIWSVGYQFIVADRRRRQLRRAFGSYLSPYMADQIAASKFDLELGGQEVEASVMFTDLEGFTKMSESLPPSEVSKILTTYFNQTTSVILQEDGTIIKYIGDAVMAVWGAPLPEKRHAQRAVLAAWGMSQAGKQEVIGRRLRTRIGVNTGTVLSGNLGSDFRFDYTCIGDTTNFAARLEGLNKYLGTDILISEYTAQQLDGGIKLRPLGRFIVAGKQKAVGIFEVLGLAKDFPQDPSWFTEFAAAMEKFQRGELEAAEQMFRQVIALHDGKDGPAHFYLQYITKAIAKPERCEGWDGAVRLDEK